MNELMTIRQMCEAYDVTPRTLRFYEAKELLTPIRTGPERLFTRRDRARLELILRGKRFGFSLEDIRQTLDLYDRDGRTAQRERACELALTPGRMEAQRAELDVAIADLKAGAEPGRERAWCRAAADRSGAFDGTEGRGKECRPTPPP